MVTEDVAIFFLFTIFPLLGLIVLGIAIYAFSTLSGLRARVDAMGAELGLVRSQWLDAERRLLVLENARHESHATHAPPPNSVTEPETETETETETESATATEMATESATETETETETGTETETETGRGTDTGTDAHPRAEAPARGHVSLELLRAKRERAGLPPSDAAQPSAPMPSEAPPSNVGFEQWLGVRGAAALGAVVLVIAGLYFVKYSIDSGWITPAWRALLGALVGIGCIAAAETVLRKRYAPLASWMAGAGIALLYITSWAARSRYDLIGSTTATVCMIVVTVLCCVLSLRQRAAAVALLGLLGGFATPIAVSTGEDRPIALFSYLFVLDTALLFVAGRRRWPGLVLLALVATAAYQVTWIVGLMGADRLLLGMTVVAAFAALFAWSTARDKSEASALSVARGLSLVVPFLFAVYFGVRAELSPEFGPLAAFLLVLTAGAAWLSRCAGTHAFGVLAALGSLGTLTAWLVTHSLEPASTWLVMGFVVALSLLLLLRAAFDPAHPAFARGAVALASLGGLMVTGGAALVPSTPNAPAFLLGWLLLASCALGAARHERWRFLAVPTAVVLAGVVGLLQSAAAVRAEMASGAMSGLLAPDRLLFVEVAIATALALLARLQRPGAGRGETAIAAAVLAALWLLFSLGVSGHAGVNVTFTAVLGLAAVCVAAGALARVAGVSTWTVVLLFAAGLTRVALADSAECVPALAWLAVIAAAFVALPLALPARLRELRSYWRSAALAPLLLMIPAAVAFDARFGDDAIGVVPAAAALMALAALALVGRRGPLDAANRRVAATWLGGSALLLLAIAVPMQFEDAAWTIGWAVLGAVALTVWRRVDHDGLKLAAFALLALVAARLVLNPQVLDYFPRGDLRVLNWLLPTYLLPALCLFFGARLLHTGEARAARPPPLRLAPMVSLFGIAVVFAWLNLTILDWYATGEWLTVPFDHVPARDLTVSLAWALYALVLLAFGVAKKSVALRVLSLALVLVTSLKVFLYDLSHLEDLFRVASLGGLALSLIAISLAYQRFVFTRPEADAPDPPQHPPIPLATQGGD